MRKRIVVDENFFNNAVKLLEQRREDCLKAIGDKVFAQSKRKYTRNGRPTIMMDSPFRRKGTNVDALCNWNDFIRSGGTYWKQPTMNS